ncbi:MULTISPECIES: hypothetical protein [unclassified Streptomyces]
MARPDLVSGLVIMAARGHSDAMSTALTRAEQEPDDLGIELPA